MTKKKKLCNTGSRRFSLETATAATATQAGQNTQRLKITYKYQSICLLSICPSIYLIVYLSIHISIIYQSICLSVCPSIYLSMCPSLHLSIYPSIHLSIYPSIHLSISPSLHLSIYPSNLSVWLFFCLYINIMGVLMCDKNNCNIFVSQSKECKPKQCSLYQLFVLTSCYWRGLIGQVVHRTHKLVWSINASNLSLAIKIIIGLIDRPINFLIARHKWSSLLFKRAYLCHVLLAQFKPFQS